MSEETNKEPQEQDFNWQRQTAADQLVRELVNQFCEMNSFAKNLRQRMLDMTGTRLIDWVDHLCISTSTVVGDSAIEPHLGFVGFEFSESDSSGRWYRHDGGLFPAFCLADSGKQRLAIKVDSVSDFLQAHELQGLSIEGGIGSQFRRVCVAQTDESEFWVCERSGYSAWALTNESEAKPRLAAAHAESFFHRERTGKSDVALFEATKSLCRAAVDDLGTDWACELFFESERRYWQNRNHAARVQKGRQDRLGLGWSNHDHHTYRSSREAFAAMIEVFEILGFHCRERFYAGEQAGWGAQVLEQPVCGIVIFADVDLSPEELEGDFAHDGLEPQEQLGTVGLWCQLHGEAILQAGMHHLECTFDFDAARQQLAALGVESMEPFTDTAHLRQAFTVGEVWAVDSQRVETAAAKGYLDRDQADKFLDGGSIGSHMEILERNDGYKGFNQTGVSSIIKKTDPRTAELVSE